MSNDQEIVALLQRVNPIPDLEMVTNHRERLWASVEPRQIAQTIKPRAPRRRRLVLAIAALAAVISAGVAGALLYSDAPPLDRSFDTVDGSTLTVYGDSQGLPDGCAARTAFTSAGMPLVGGHCGIFELVKGRWNSIADEVAVGGHSFYDMVVDGVGGIWITSMDRPLQRLHGDVLTEMEIMSPWITAPADGSIWAVDFDYTRDSQLLTTYSGGDWHPISESGRVYDIAADNDGQVWFLNQEGLNKAVGDTIEAVELGWAAGSLVEVAISPDGSVWLLAASNEVTYRLGVSDTVSYLVHYDGKSISNTEIPFAEVNGLAIDADGTVWTSSSLHGVFAYDGSAWTRFGESDGLPANEVRSINISPDGSVYVATGLGLARIQVAG